MPVCHSSLAKCPEARLLNGAGNAETENFVGVKTQRFRCPVGPGGARERIAGGGLGDKPGTRGL